MKLTDILEAKEEPAVGPGSFDPKTGNRIKKRTMEGRVGTDIKKIKDKINALTDVEEAGVLLNILKDKYKELESYKKKK